jgi:hypothetical protein
MQTDIFSTCGLITISLLNLGKILRYTSSFVKLVKANINVSKIKNYKKDVNGILG